MLILIFGLSAYYYVNFSEYPATPAFFLDTIGQELFGRPLYFSITCLNEKQVTTSFTPSANFLWGKIYFLDKFFQKKPVAWII